MAGSDEPKHGDDRWKAYKEVKQNRSMRKHEGYEGKKILVRDEQMKCICRPLPYDNIDPADVDKYVSVGVAIHDESLECACKYGIRWSEVNGVE